MKEILKKIGNTIKRKNKSWKGLLSYAGDIAQPSKEYFER